MNIFQQSKRSISTSKKTYLNLEETRDFLKDMLWGPKIVVYLLQRSFLFSHRGKDNFCLKADYNDATLTLTVTFLWTFYFSKVKYVP